MERKWEKEPKYVVYIYESIYKKNNEKQNVNEQNLVVKRNKISLCVYFYENCFSMFRFQNSLSQN